MSSNMSDSTTNSILSPTVTITEISTIDSLSTATTQPSFSSSSSKAITSATLKPFDRSDPRKVPYTVVTICVAYSAIVLGYMIYRWRQRARINYIIPRVFVLCSPRTVQFHYELILRVGLASSDFNPDKHDIDVTVFGLSRNEVVPMTRLNTRTLYDEPLITCLSIIVYRLVELPKLGSLLLKHSGGHKSWIFAYDFTVIDLTTSQEQFYTLNKYISGMDRSVPLQDPIPGQVHYPIDDIPMPKWSAEDIVIVLCCIFGFIFISITLMPINCTYTWDIIIIFITSFGSLCFLIFLDWLFYYNLKWNSERKEYFNDYHGYWFMPSDNICRIFVFVVSIVVVGIAIYFGSFIDNSNEFYVWLLCITNTCTIVGGFWNAAIQANLFESIVDLGLKMRGIVSTPIGLKDEEAHNSNNNRLSSTSDEDGSSSIIATHSATRSSMSSGQERQGISRVAMNIGPRSSVKSFGFELLSKRFGSNDKLHHSSKVANQHSRASSTGSTPNNYPSSRIMNRPMVKLIIKKPEGSLNRSSIMKATHSIQSTNNRPNQHSKTASDIKSNRSNSGGKPTQKHGPVK